MLRADFDRFVDLLQTHAASDDRFVGLVLLGSTASPNRIDEWSDHDFWVVTRPGRAGEVRADDSWLPDRDRIVVFAPDTDHGRIVIYDDGHLLEFAVFEPGEVTLAQANEYRVIHDEIGLAGTMAEIASRPLPVPKPDRLFGKLASQITIGVTRWARGERLSANHLVRGWAARTLVEILSLTLVPSDRAPLDGFDPNRRFELAAPEAAAEIDRALESTLLDCAESLLRIAARSTEMSPAGIAAVMATIERARAASSHVDD
jgi:hypothetical protein